MEGMKAFPNKFFDLAIVDPPYGIGNTTISAGNKKRKTLHKRMKWNDRIPSSEYFNELYRISENQIIFGANYFYPHISVSGRIIHYKKPYQKLNENKILFCPCDIASQSFNKRIEYFEYNWFGNAQGGKINWNNTGPDARIHPTQKPIALYKWLLKLYAKSGQKIIDTHAGSCSSVIAFLDFGCDWIAFEIDRDYYEAANKRIENHKRQLKINFDSD
jgi:site-specific DNA-methyltransferase (adenine-specific)